MRFLESSGYLGCVTWEEISCRLVWHDKNFPGEDSWRLPTTSVLLSTLKEFSTHSAKEKYWAEGGFWINDRGENRAIGGFFGGTTFGTGLDGKKGGEHRLILVRKTSNLELCY